MQISEAWLRSFVNPEISTETLIEQLTMAGLEVGSQMRAEGMVGEDEGSMVILNPSYELLV